MTPSPPAPENFAATRWTLVVAARGASTAARTALSELCAAYYAPVVAFLRREGRSDDEARDLAHSFFAKVLEGGQFDGADQAKGKFRSYLLGALKHFLQHERRARLTERRGGEIEHVALRPPTETSAGFDVAAPPAPGLDHIFDRQWALTVLDRAMVAVAGEMEGLGKRSHFEAMRPWLSGEVPGASQAELAARLGLSPGAAKVAIHRLRQRFRDQVMAEIAQTVVGGGEPEVREELNYLIAVISTQG
jgi:DNA-directed RNA polymerase specialized sigma24 family protein